MIQSQHIHYVQLKGKLRECNKQCTVNVVIMSNMQVPTLSVFPLRRSLTKTPVTKRYYKNKV